MVFSILTVFTKGSPKPFKRRIESLQNPSGAFGSICISIIRTFHVNFSRSSGLMFGKIGTLCPPYRFQSNSFWWHSAFIIYLQFFQLFILKYM
jgi:hypothetical protein